MAVRDWSFARLLVVLTLGSSVSLGLGLATVGAYVAAPDDDPLVRFWEQNRWVLLPACAGFLASVFALYALVAACGSSSVSSPWASRSHGRGARVIARTAKATSTGRGQVGGEAC